MNFKKFLQSKDVKYAMSILQIGIEKSLIRIQGFQKRYKGILKEKGKFIGK